MFAKGTQFYNTEDRISMLISNISHKTTPHLTFPASSISPRSFGLKETTRVLFTPSKLCFQSMPFVECFDSILQAKWHQQTLHGQLRIEIPP